MIFSRPSDGTSEKHRCPMLAVGLSAGTSALHMYQRPLVNGNYQTKSLECTCLPGLSLMSNSFATSATFPLADVSDSSFTCGLASLQIPTTRVLTGDGLQQVGYFQHEAPLVVCALTCTNKGDVYSNFFLASNVSHKRSSSFADTPLGHAAISIPSSEESAALFDTTSAHNGHISLSLSSVYPSARKVIEPAPRVPLCLNKPVENSDRVGIAKLGEAPDLHERKTLFQPSGFLEVVIATGREESRHISMQNHLVEQTLEDYVHNLNSFQHNEILEDGQDERSDVTPQFLDVSCRSWPVYEPEIEGRDNASNPS
jgi:hypothetical protein